MKFFATEKNTESFEQQTTPHKRAVYRSPLRKSSLKKKGNPGQWKKNIHISLKSQGKEYTSATGKVIGAKAVRPHNCQQCKCAENFTEEEIFTFYFNLGSYKRQRQ